MDGSFVAIALATRVIKPKKTVLAVDLFEKRGTKLNILTSALRGQKKRFFSITVTVVFSTEPNVQKSFVSVP